MTKLYEAFVIIRIAVEENDPGNALIAAYGVAQELATAMPTGAQFEGEYDRAIYDTLKEVELEVATIGAGDEPLTECLGDPLREATLA